eukprot:9493824-Pyramimonas_sp.AAC.1
MLNNYARISRCAADSNPPSNDAPRCLKTAPNCTETTRIDHIMIERGPAAGGEALTDIHLPIRPPYG